MSDSDVNRIIRLRTQRVTQRIRQRDGFRCRICGCTKGRLEVHHIDRLEKVIKAARRANPRLAEDALADWIILNVKSVTNPQGLVTLCEPCHDGPLDPEKLGRMAEEAGPLPPPFPDRKHDDRDRSQHRIPGVEVYPAAVILTGQVVAVRGNSAVPAAVVGRAALGDEEAVYIGSRTGRSTGGTRSPRRP